MLATGKRPFPERKDFAQESLNNFVPYSVVTEAEGSYHPPQNPLEKKNSAKANFEYAALMTRVPYPPHVSPELKVR